MAENEYDRCYFPDITVERMANILLIQCKTEDDAIVAFEIFRQIAVGNPVWIGKEGGIEN